MKTIIYFESENGHCFTLLGRRVDMPFLACLSKEECDRETMLKEAISCMECHLLCDSKRVLDQHVHMMHSEGCNLGLFKKNVKLKAKCVHCAKVSMGFKNILQFKLF